MFFSSFSDSKEQIYFFFPAEKRNECTLEFIIYKKNFFCFYSSHLFSGLQFDFGV